MSAVLTSHRFPPGTKVAVYPQDAWGVHERPPSGPPPKGARTVARGKRGARDRDGIRFGKPVKAGQAYYAYAEVDGEHRYVQFVGK